MIDFLFKRHNSNARKWWIKISTIVPKCVYYFGPFNSVEEAKSHRHGYIEDLVLEKALGITVELTHCRPNCLTIYKE